MTEVPTNETDRKRSIDILDRLLCVEARKPGTAAKLPAVIRVIEALEPAGGTDFPIFPASYAGAADNDPPVYDLSGIVYGEVQEKIRVKRVTVDRPQVIRAERCTVDSPQSQANRTEVAFLEDESLKSLVPRGCANIPRHEGRDGGEDLLRLPHRIADFRVRLSDRREEVKTAISSFANGDALNILKLMPTSIVFGFWDSRGEGTQHKHARILLSRIDAFDVVPCRRHALYSGPYSADEFANAVLDKTTADKAEADEMAKQGYTNAPSEGLGGVLVKGKIERLALISLTDIARLNCRKVDGNVDVPKTNAARRYVFALSALAEAYPRSTGSHRLRSGCELVSKSDPAVDLRGGDSSYGEAADLKKLYRDRQMLVAIATEAKETLEIPDEAGPFNVTRGSLRGDFGVSNTPSPGPTASGAEVARAARPPRRASKKTR
jgi:CRISPR-associated protein Csb1